MKYFYLIAFFSVGITSIPILSNPRIFSRFVLRRRAIIATVISAAEIYESYRVVEMIKNIPVGTPNN